MLIIKGYRVTLSHVFVLAGTDVAVNSVIIRMFSSFKKNCCLREIKLLEWNLTMVLRSLIHLLRTPEILLR